MMTSTATRIGTTAAAPAATPRAPPLRAHALATDRTVTAEISAAEVGPLRILPPKVRAELPSQRPSEEIFKYLAEHHPDALLLLIENGDLAASELTFAAEVAGEVSGSERALLGLLAHGSAVVREGAVYGLAKRLSIEVRRRLLDVAENDRSPAVRTAATEVLAE